LLSPGYVAVALARLARRLRRSTRRGVVRLLRWSLLPFHRPLCFLDYYVRAYRLVREAPSDVYHGHDLNALPVAWWSRHKLGGKLIYDSHEIYTETSNLRRLERKVAALVERFLIRRVDAVITIHDTAADELARRYGVPKPSVVKNCPRIPPGCNRTTRLKDAIGLADSDLIVLYQGGFTKGRGLPHLIQAMTYLPEHMKLVMMGWGRIEPELRVLTEELGLLDCRVFFIPPVPQNELLHWTASANVGVIPYQAVSLNNYLCMPNKLFEYMGAGLPIVASAFPELTRVIEGALAGVTFDPEVPESIAAAVNRVLGDADLRARMSENARKASLIYNWENEEKSLLAVYSRVAA
jgi:glycosyltransferase involved in cell wall biosynthesis